MASNRPWLVVAALLAGGLTAGLVLALLHFFLDPKPQTAPEPAPTQDVGGQAPTP